MNAVLEASHTFCWHRTRLHVGGDLLVLDRSTPVSRRAMVSGVAPYDDIREVTVVGRGRRPTLRLSLHNGQPDWVVPRVPRAEAQWAASLIADRLTARDRSGLRAFTQRVSFQALQQQVQELLTGDDRQIIDLVDVLLLQAVHAGASDVHFEPFRTDCRVRYRLDGVLHEVATLPGELHDPLLSRLKVVSQLKVFDNSRPQEGRLVAQVGERSVDLRLTTLPTIHGEKATVRLFDPQRGMLGLDDLGMSEAFRQEWRNLLQQPQGTVFLTGPSGSGKTTTLYASLLHLHESRRNLSSIATVEDPVEYDLKVINQTQTNPDVGLTFAAGLRSLLRQDPEVIMIGETRDAETADIAVRAGLTGHLIFSTLHAKSSAAVFLRLIEMGVEPFLVASSVTAVLAQRLVRTNCPNCTEEYEPDPETLDRLSLAFPAEVHFRHGVGCASCADSGYAGRTGLFELVTVTEALHDLLLTRAPERDVAAAIRDAGVTSLAEDGISKVTAGSTTPEELLRVLGMTTGSLPKGES